MKYYVIFNIPDDQVIFEGRPALLFSHSEDSDVLTVTIAEEVIPEESLNYADDDAAQGGLASAT